MDVLVTHYKDEDGALLGAPESLFVWWKVESVELSRQNEDSKNENVSPRTYGKLYDYLRILDFNRGKRLDQYLRPFLTRLEEDVHFRWAVDLEIKGMQDFYIAGGITRVLVLQFNMD